MKNFILLLSLLFVQTARAAEVSAAIKSQRGQWAKNFVIERGIFPAGASLTSNYLQGILNNSATVFVRNLSITNQMGALVLVHSASDRTILSTPLQNSMAALNTYTPYEAWNITSAAQATVIFKGLLDLVESGCKDVSCVMNESEYRCSYTTSFGYSKSAMMTKTGQLR